MNKCKVKKLGILGGTFNPIHYGHIGCAEAAARVLNINKILFIPANNPNFKQNEHICAVKDRIKMCELALIEHGNKKFAVSDIETKRKGITYTPDTLEILKNKYPDTELIFIIGSDSLKTLCYWNKYEKILELSTIACVTRHGYKHFDDNQNKLISKYPNKIKIIEASVIDASSNHIRQLFKTNKKVSEFIASSVEAYINEHNLY